MSKWSTFEELWRKATGDTITAVFVTPQIRTGLYSSYEFDFASGLVIQLCMDHKGLASFDVPIRPSEYVERLPLDVSCVGQTLESVSLLYDQRTAQPHQVRLHTKQATVQFRFIWPDEMVMEAADTDTAGWVTL